jgi:hypothetical protein
MVRSDFTKVLQDSKQVQYDQYDRKYDQDVHPAAGFWETWTYIPTKKAEQPNNYQNDDDNPNERHEISPSLTYLMIYWQPPDRG